MKHKMNKISGYYEGPSGMFYDFKHDMIFELEYECARCYRMGVGNVGNFYRYRTIQSKSKQCVMTGMTNVIRLGDL